MSRSCDVATAMRQGERPRDAVVAVQRHPRDAELLRGARCSPRRRARARRGARRAPTSRIGCGASRSTPGGRGRPSGARPPSSGRSGGAIREPAAATAARAAPRSSARGRCPASRGRGAHRARRRAEREASGRSRSPPSRGTPGEQRDVVARRAAAGRDREDVRAGSTGRAGTAAPISSSSGSVGGGDDADVERRAGAADADDLAILRTRSSAPGPRGQLADLVEEEGAAVRRPRRGRGASRAAPVNAPRCIRRARPRRAARDRRAVHRDEGPPRRRLPAEWIAWATSSLRVARLARARRATTRRIAPTIEPSYRTGMRRPSRPPASRRARRIQRSRAERRGGGEPSCSVAASAPALHDLAAGRRRRSRR